MLNNREGYVSPNLTIYTSYMFLFPIRESEGTDEKYRYLKGNM